MLDFLIVLFAGAVCVVFGLSRGGYVGALLGLTLIVMANFAVRAIAMWRHVQVIRQWAQGRKLTIGSVKSFHGFLDLPGLPWWTGGRLYVVSARESDGTEREFHLFLQGVAFCLFHINLTESETNRRTHM